MKSRVHYAQKTVCVTLKEERRRLLILIKHACCQYETQPLANIAFQR